MGRMVKKLSGLEIDEVSLVDRPANQHGLVAIAKRQEDGMSIFDAQGHEVDEAELEHGDVVYDDNGTELVFVEEEDGDDGDDDGVEKGVRDYVARRAVRGTTVAREPHTARSNWTPDGGGRGGSNRPLKAQMRARAAATDARNELRHRGDQVRSAGRRARNAGTAAGMQYRAIPEGGRAGLRYAGAAGAGGASEYERRKHFGKSMGDQVLEDLSKALTDDARDEVIAKAYDYFEDVAKSNDELRGMVEDLIADRETDDFVELAKGYELPVDETELGGLMYRASQFLPQEDVEVLDRLFSAHGEIAKGYMTEIGYNGAGESDIVAQVYAAAGEAVGKSAGAMSQEQAVTALFDANPAAYDAYEAEQRMR